MQRDYFGLMAVVLVGLLIGSCATAQVADPDQGRKRNVILFLGDGMGVSTVTAARIFAGQLKGDSGEENLLSFETFPHVALIKTYNTDRQVPDSAGTMSAIVTGEKTRAGVLSIAASVPRGDCAQALTHELPTLLELAEQRGLATGIVSTARITHATPAATYSHGPERDWEDDGTLPQAAKIAGCRDIARQLVEFPYGNGPEVILGGGRQHFLPKEQSDPEYPGKSGIRGDGANLIDVWLAAGTDRTYVWNNTQFSALSAADDGQLLGLFEPSHMQFEADRPQDPGTEPTLLQMTRFAIERLQHNDRGFFLMVEAGRIDHGHHAGNAYRALTDTVAFADAISEALRLTSPGDTLILVTADHSHTLTIGGMYPERGNPILGKAAIDGKWLTDSTGKPYTTLSYANGPGYRKERPDLTDVDTQAKDYRQVAAIPIFMETHAGEDVAAYAFGVNAEALHGVMEQNELYAILYTALFGQEP